MFHDKPTTQLKKLFHLIFQRRPSNIYTAIATAALFKQFDYFQLFQLIVTMFDARRGNEGIQELKVGNFKKFEDKNRCVHYFKKVHILEIE